MTDQALYNIVVNRCEQARLEPISRTTFGEPASEISWMQIGTVVDLARHSNVRTTQRYDRGRERRKRSAADLVHLPYLESRSRNPL